ASVRRAAASTTGTKTEVKNINSFAYVEMALSVERDRQIALLEGGGTVAQQTLLYDSKTSSVRPQRSKEESHDYRYFPDPDLPPLVLTEEFVAQQHAQPAGGQTRVRRGGGAGRGAAQRRGGTRGRPGRGQRSRRELGERGARRAPAGGHTLQERRHEADTVFRGSGDEAVAREGGSEARAASPGRKASRLSGRATVAALATPASTRVPVRAARSAPPPSA